MGMKYNVIIPVVNRKLAAPLLDSIAANTIIPANILFIPLKAKIAELLVIWILLTLMVSMSLGLQTGLMLVQFFTGQAVLIAQMYAVHLKQKQMKYA